MPVFTFLMVVIVIASGLVCYLTLMRLKVYNERYPLPESKHTKLFGIITKEHIAIIYSIFTVAHAVFTFWFLITL